MLARWQPSILLFPLYTQAILPLKGKVHFSSPLNLGWSMTSLIITIQRKWCHVTSEARSHEASQPLLEPFGTPTLGVTSCQGRSPAALRPSCCGEAQDSHVKKLQGEMPGQASAVPAFPAQELGGSFSWLLSHQPPSHCRYVRSDASTVQLRPRPTSAWERRINYYFKPLHLGCFVMSHK